uniref:Uncharacterized protein n=1 Tax=Meloidogyne incognita TaxID=6306 RepID=A0A914NRX5_MELIC
MSIYILFPLLLIFYCINAEITMNEWPGAGKKMARGGLVESEGILDHLDYFETRQEASTGLKMPQTNARRCLFPWNC